MIAIDTNVLLRYLLEDDAEQFRQAVKLMSGQQKVLVTDVVLVETIWTLRGKKYQLKKPELVTVIQSLFQEPNIRFEDGQAVWLALTDYQNAKPVKGKEADFTDALIVNKSKQAANKENKPFYGAFTFDLAAQTLPGAKTPK
ncbi:PIN domain-containing protein [Desulfobacter vibrioformis]|uniref:PIN domain-containing protein n=1 Tax=Desulfobacter vibrioformis TaxID=34031 RepID=UPI0005528357|nr:type II toxin-antitoxin system VapC family toxin [Desulfobacter vibrioformis]